MAVRPVEHREPRYPTRIGCLLVIGLATLSALPRLSAAPPAPADFERDVKPILAEYCFGCHADGANEGSMSLDDLLAIEQRDVANAGWYRVLKQLQAGLMPPAEEEQPSKDQLAKIERWIKFQAFAIDPDHPDPGHVTVRRLNQVEYRNTIRDLLGVDYDTDANFPADDTGHGFDNIGEVLSISPLLLEKYVNSAKEIISSVVPTVSGVIRQTTIPGDRFQLDAQSIAASMSDGEQGQGRAMRGRRGPRIEEGTIELSYYKNLRARADLQVEQAGDYILRLNIEAKETYVDNQFDTNRCEFTFSLGDQVLLQQPFVRQNNTDFSFEFPKTLSAGKHALSVAIRPLTEEDQIRNLRIQVKSVDLIGPDDEQFFDKPEGYQRFFPGVVPDSADGRREYAANLLRDFARRAFRRPVDEITVTRLVDLAESVYGDGDATFESGIAKSMTAILASPRFLFREEGVIGDSSEPYPLIDQHALASRLSYFLWSSMPDEELSRLADEGQLRASLDQQVRRMLSDEKARALSENFVGQWLRARAIDSIQINGRAVVRREPRNIDPDGDIRRRRFFELFRKGQTRTAAENQEFEREREVFRRSFQSPAFGLTDDLRTAMRRETELQFEHIVEGNRSLLELIDSNYTFLNEDLWAHYQIDGIDRVEGDRMRLVELPEDSLRGGVLTQGTFLVVTSNPDRTSPVKRGLFILENLLGSPPPAPPPNIPALEDVETDQEQPLSLRETLAIHRSNTLCASCHNRMDPLGLALENFNALGRFRTVELGQAVEAAGVFGDDHEFASIRDLKRILVTHYRTQIYRCMAEKMMTYALGRAVEYTDAHTIDELVARLDADDGRASTLIDGIIQSSAFQRTRNPEHLVANPHPSR